MGIHVRSKHNTAIALDLRKLTNDLRSSHHVYVRLGYLPAWERNVSNPFQCTAYGACSDLNAGFFNFMYSLVTPYMIKNMKWGTFLFYAVLDLCMAVFVWTCLKEVSFLHALTENSTNYVLCLDVRKVH